MDYVRCSLFGDDLYSGHSQDNWLVLNERFKGAFLLVRLVKSLTEDFASDEMAQEIEAFFKVATSFNFDRSHLPSFFFFSSAIDSVPTWDCNGIFLAFFFFGLLFRNTTVPARSALCSRASSRCAWTPPGWSGTRRPSASTCRRCNAATAKPARRIANFFGELHVALPLARRPVPIRCPDSSSITLLSLALSFFFSIRTLIRTAEEKPLIESRCYSSFVLHFFFTGLWAAHYYFRKMNVTKSARSSKTKVSVTLQSSLMHSSI